MFTHVAARTVRCPPKGVFSRSASDHSSPPDPPRVLPAGARVCRPGFPPGRTVHLDQGTHTNTVERSIRPISIGKKNSLFAGDEGGGETWAILSSLLNTARLNGLDPEAYLIDVLERMVSGRTTNDRLHELLAWNWKPEAAQANLAA